MPLLLFRIGFSEDIDVGAAADDSKRAAEAAFPLLRLKRERRSVIEGGGRRSDRAAQQLAPAAFQLNPDPAFVGRFSKQVVADGKLGFGLLGDYDALADLEDVADDLRTAIAMLADEAGLRPGPNGSRARLRAATPAST